jgi:hypothetical protein
MSHCAGRVVAEVPRLKRASGSVLALALFLVPVWSLCRPAPHDPGLSFRRRPVIRHGPLERSDPPPRALLGYPLSSGGVPSTRGILLDSPSWFGIA